MHLTVIKSIAVLAIWLPLTACGNTAFGSFLENYSSVDYYQPSSETESSEESSNGVEYIFVGKSADWKKAPANVKVSIQTCSNIPQDLIGHVTAVHTRNTCARLWDNWNCTGASAEIMARSPSHANLTPWGFNDRTISVGPCRDNCDIEVTGQMPNDAFQIQLFSGKDFKSNVTDGQQGSLNLTVSGCTQVPSNFQDKVASILTFRQCVQLWSTSNCTLRNRLDDTVELRWGTPMHEDIKGGWAVRTVKAVSHCRYKCNDTTTQNLEDVIRPRGWTTHANYTTDNSTDKSAMESKSGSSGCSGWTTYGLPFFMILLGMSLAIAGYLVFKQWQSKGIPHMRIPKWRAEEEF